MSHPLDGERELALCDPLARQRSSRSEEISVYYKKSSQMRCGHIFHNIWVRTLTDKSL